MTAAFNDIGILTWPNGHTVIMSAFLTDSHEPEARMNELFKTIARVVIADLGRRSIATGRSEPP
jgi:beta-lactamase class A